MQTGNNMAEASLPTTTSQRLLHQLPTELLIDIARLLRQHDLFNLSLVSSLFNAVASPMIWESVDLHPAYFHASHHSHILRGQQRHQRFMRPMSRFERRGRHQHLLEQSTTFALRRWAVLRRQDPERWKVLAAKVRVLCVTVDPDGRICPVGGDVVQGDRRELDAWNTILSFGNLEVLEVIGKLDVIGSALKVGEVGRFEKLRRVRFRGYMPSEFVRSVLYKAPGLEELDLGVLDPLENATETGTFPQSLRGIFDNLPSADFSKLRRLHLCKPSEPPEQMRTDWDETHPMANDLLALNEWSNFLQSVRSSLIDLTLEQRPAIIGSSYKGAPVLQQNVPADVRFCDMLLPLFLEEDWTPLRSLQFCGVEVRQQDDSMWDELQERLGKVDVSVHRGNFMYYVGGAHRSICHFDHEDGLVPSFER